MKVTQLHEGEMRQAHQFRVTNRDAGTRMGGRVAAVAFLFGRRKHGDFTHTLTTTDVDFFVGGGRGRRGGGGGGCSFCSCSATTVLFGKGAQTTTDDQPHLQRHRETKNSQITETQQNSTTTTVEQSKRMSDVARCQTLLISIERRAYKH
jgi:hypothetical protein